MWEKYLYASLAILGAAVLLSIVCNATKRKKILGLDTVKWLFAGVAVSALALFLPIYSGFLEENNGGFWQSFMTSLHYVFRLFLVDFELEFVVGEFAGMAETTAKGYTLMFSILGVVGPILTFGFVMSFFKNIAAYYHYGLNFFSDAYIFSGLNEKTYSLAHSLHTGSKKRKVFVFTDVFENGDENTYELIEKTKELGAICFKKDILALNFKFHSPYKRLFFFVMGEDISENTKHALSLVEKYEKRKNARLYVLSSNSESEAILANEARRLDAKYSSKPRLIIRRVNEVQSLIMRNLYDNGYESIFKSAYEEDGFKKINAVVVGMGQHGTEMVKALSWFGQMDGYRLEINAIERDPLAKSKFTSRCPELMKFSGIYDIDGETEYTINIFGGIDVETSEFDDILKIIGRATYVFVSLGDDEINVAAAMKIRMLCKRMGAEPVIQAVVYNSDKKEALKDIKNFRGEEYNIDFIGDLRSSYSEKVILGTDLELEALNRHLAYDPNGENDFWTHSYNYRSSVASVIHHRMKRECDIPGAKKLPENREHDELWAIRKLEHRRWNAYTRSEGYVYGGSIKREEGRCDLAKRHNFLVPFAELPLREQEKDDD